VETLDLKRKQLASWSRDVLERLSLLTEHEISCLLWKLNIHYDIHNNHQSIILSQINPVLIFVFNFIKFHPNIIISATVLLKRDHFTSDFVTEDTSPIFSLLATYFAHLIFIDLITLITFSQKKAKRSFSLCTVLNSVTFSVRDLNIFLSHFFSNTLYFLELRFSFR
jgi:hypothetical protein